MELLNKNELKDVYRIFEKSFISEELRSYNSVKPYIDNGSIKMYGYKENDVLKGAMYVWELDSCIFIENFAVDPTRRGQGIGGIMLEEIKKIYNNHMIVLEVEKPIDEDTKKRIDFYNKHQWLLNDKGYIQPTLHYFPTSIELLMMSYPHLINDTEWNNIKNDIFKVVYLVEK